MKAAATALLVLLAACASSPPGSARGAGNTATSDWPRISVPGGELEYQVTGIGEPLLLIHGSVFANVFDKMVGQRSLSKYQLIRYHRRGFAGSSRVAPPFTIQQQAADAFALLDNLQLRRVHVLGHSYGGSIALEMARQEPDRVATLVLLEAAVPSLAPPDARLMESITAAYALFAKGDKRGALRTFGDALTPGTFDEMAARSPEMTEQAVADAQTFFEVEMPALQQWQYGSADLTKMRIPALVVLGQLTPSALRPGHYALMKDIAGAQELVVRGASHELQMQQPRAVAEGVAAFLAQHPLRERGAQIPQ